MKKFKLIAWTEEVSTGNGKSMITYIPSITLIYSGVAEW
jgi:hypothetical protein